MPQVIQWKNFWLSVGANVCFVLLVYHPFLIVPLLFLSIIARGLSRLRRLCNKPEKLNPPLMNLDLSLGDSDSDSGSDIGKLPLPPLVYFATHLLRLWAETFEPWPELLHTEYTEIRQEDEYEEIAVSNEANSSEHSKPSEDVSRENENDDNEEPGGAFSSYVRYHYAVRRRQLRSKFRKINPFAIYKVKRMVLSTHFPLRPKNPSCILCRISKTN